MIDVAIIGLGPWGLSALERLLDGARGREVTVHVVEPGPTGSGVFSVDQPDYFILNTPCGQHSLHPFPEQGAHLGFFDWVQARGYRWVGDRCQVTASGRHITPDDFLPRRLLGEYLEWFYDELVRNAADGIRVVHHRELAVDITQSEDRERIRLAGGSSFEVDYAILATGHTENLGMDSDPARSAAWAPYRADAYASALEPGATVAVSGMGLVALDVVIALTRGRGGQFVGEERLRYLPSGHEPVIHMFSRTGEPYRAKSHGTVDPTGDYVPTICTLEAIEATRRRREAETGSPQLDMRTDIMPLILAEMEMRFYEQSARLSRGEEAARSAKSELTAAWSKGTFALTRSAHAAVHGRFDAAESFFNEDLLEPISAKDFQEHVYSTVADDLAEALVRGGTTPTKAAQEVLRVLRDTMRSAVEFRGLTLGSYLDFQANLRSKVTRSITGPPAFRCQQLLALMDADVVRMPFGPSPTVVAEASGGYQVSSDRLVEPYSRHVEVLIQGHLDDPTCDRSASLLLQNLHRNGRIRQLHYGSVSVGSVDLSEDLHPIGRRDEPQRRLFILGALTEGVRYFTAYIPSPKSRVRAFVDAQACVERILAATP